MYLKAGCAEFPGRGASRNNRAGHLNSRAGQIANVRLGRSMPDEKERFQTTGKPWSERARLGELDAVLTGSGNDYRNVFLHHTHLVAAHHALRLLPRRSIVVDFGCGTGRFLRFFARHGHSVIGTEVTSEMLDKASTLGIPSNCRVAITNGIDIPIETTSVDAIWVCGVLRYSLNILDPVYDRIAAEMYRVLKPGGRVVNIEMYVDQPPAHFTRDFELAGFRTETARVINRYGGRFSRAVQSGRLPISLVALTARLVALWHYHLDSVDSRRPGLRDYLFVWRKPNTPRRRYEQEG